MDLVPYIYCEKQEQGSMLCAQHALNNLMQSPLWSPQDLAEIARTLDSLERSHLQQDGGSTRDNSNEGNSRLEKNSNYDDSGFFSVQVIDDALHRLGLRIIRWRSEEMKPMHDYPENQEAFILNHDLHWFTLRRFGHSVDRWYNLNSMDEDSPKWIGPTFLSMAIAQAEAEGYSIFVVIPVPPSSEPSAPQPGSILACEADEQAHILDQLNYSSGGRESRSTGETSSTLRRPREEGTDETSRTRMRMNTETSGVDELPYEEQIRLAIEASLSQPTDELNQTKDQKASTTLAPSNSKAYPRNTQSDNNNSPAQTQNNAELSADSDLLDQLRSLEDKELAAAISESLAENPSEPNPTDPLPANSFPPVSDEFIDEPTPEELRQRRLARFSQN
ncbi:hypothetical protein PtA15_12A419 [Puccinia triticina]|uniref:ubiquitinyl hydrolase 1 n=1 Tax=Puccinia triticina TaxID=208348 RepID=A0ABY7CZP1_9BASI|nr:uncharacterized protein PtA15_12A419 [Puccinia triticina]WAQ90430.1 hypothetical protein PtA15_12A419 [Puccinia triticina]